MPNDTTLSIVVKLRDEASAGLAAISEQVKGAAAGMTGAMSSAGSALQSFGSKMTEVGGTMRSAGTSMSVGLTLPIVALGTAVVDASMKFQASMELIRTQAGASQAEVDNMTKSVLALAKSGETGQGPQALADGLYHLESLGLRGSAAMDALKTSAQAADLGMADMEGVTNALGAAIVTGIKGTQDLNQAMGLLDATIGQGNMRMDDMVAALGTGILPVAKNFGLSLQDVGAALATLTDNGMRADESATRLRMSFSLMAAPTGNATDAFASLGLTQLQLADDMRKGGLIPAMDELKAHLDASGLSASQQADVLAKAFGGGRSDAAILTLLEQLDRLKTKYDAIGASADTFAEKVAATHETNQFKLNAALAQMQSTLIDLGATVMPLVAAALQKITVWMERLVGWWDTLSPATQKWIAIGLALLAVLGPVLVILGSIALAIGALMSPIGLVIGIIALLVVSFAIMVNGIMADIKKLQAVWNAVWTAVKDFFTQIWEDIKAVADSAIGWIMDKINAVINAFNAMRSLVAAPVNFATNAFGAIGNTAQNLFSGHFETGGTVPGLRGQEVPIIAHAGEQIIPAGQSGGRGSTNISVQINYPTVRSNSDLDAMRKQIEQVLRPVLLNAKVAHI